MRTRQIGAAFGVVVGVLVALLPLGKAWEIHSFTIIPGGIAAGFGAVVAGYFVGPSVGSRANALAAVAVRFAAVMYLGSLPLVALGAALLGSRPLDEPWPVTFGPVTWVIFGMLSLSPVLVPVSVGAALAWTVLVRQALVSLSRSPSSTDIRRR